jgi:phage gp36-like protein
MGTYIQQSDLQGKLGVNKLTQLADPDGTGEIQTSIVNDAIAAAEGRLEAYLRTRYSLPVPATPLVIALCLDLAIFSLFQDASTVDDGVYKVRKDAHDSAVKTLEAIHSGRAALDIPAAEETKTSPGSENEVLRGSEESPGIFTNRNLRSY